MHLNYPLRLQNVHMNYKWGSTDTLQRLFSIPAEKGKPQAEMWIGAHPKASSTVMFSGSDRQPIALHKLIQQNCQDLLGKKTGELSFLFKLLSADKPLSIQVHPNKKQAIEGFNRENMENIPLNDFSRNYHDNNHKPELIYAYTPFRAMCGFRPKHEISHHIQLLNSHGVSLPDFLSDFGESKQEIRLIFAWMLSMTNSEKEHVIEQVLNIADKNSGNQIFDAVRLLYEHYPHDSAIIAPFWLNLIDLKPGEALFLEAGCPHAYLHGTGFEIMACSDNVLRGGLTEKHIDISELCSVTNFKSTAISPLCPSIAYNERLKQFNIPMKDFSFGLLDINESWERQVGFPHVIFCIKGKVTITGAGIEESFEQGESCLIPSACKATLNGHGMLAIAGSGEQLITELFNPAG